jgi:DNA-binding MarR family transcriptional regulator
MPARPARPASPRWLSPPEQRAWRAFVIAAQLLLDQLDRELQRQAGLSHADYAILVALSEQPHRALRMTDLARLVRYSKTRLSETIARLEARGWVARQPCQSDRRVTFAVLTEPGLAALEAAAPGHVASVRRHVFDRLSAEQVGQLRAIGEAIAFPLMEAAGFDPHACPTGAEHPARRAAAL